jgi:2-haloacid dehalogenase
MREALTQVGLLGFDVYGTVVDWRSGIARAAAPFLKEHALPVDPFVFADEWRALYQPSMEPIRAGTRPWVPLDVLNRESLETLLHRHGANPATIPEEQLAYLTRPWERLDPWPDAVEGLTRLKQKYVIATISNGHIAGMLHLARFAHLPWDAILGAEIAQNYKPHPQTYLRSIQAAGFTPTQTAMVAAHNADLKAARSLGLRTIFIQRPTEHGPGQTTDLHPEEDWDLVTNTISDLANALRA